MSLALNLNSIEHCSLEYSKEKLATVYRKKTILSVRISRVNAFSLISTHEKQHVNLRVGQRSRKISLFREPLKDCLYMP